MFLFLLGCVCVCVCVFLFCFVLFCVFCVCGVCLCVCFCFVLFCFFPAKLRLKQFFYSNGKQFLVFKIAKSQFKVTVHCSLWAKCTQLWLFNAFASVWSSWIMTWKNLRAARTSTGKRRYRVSPIIHCCNSTTPHWITAPPILFHMVPCKRDIFVLVIFWVNINR